MVLRVESPGYVSDSIIVRFDPTTTKDYDKGEDSYDFLQAGDSTALLSLHHTYLGTNQDSIVAPLYINTIPMDYTNSQRIPLRFLCKVNGSFDFSVNQTRLNPQWKVYLEDRKVAPGVYHDITSGKYSFSHKTMADNVERFILHFASSEGIDVEEIKELAQDNPYSYSDDNGLYVVYRDFTEKPLVTTIYDMAGREVFSREHRSAPESEMYQGLTKGVYMVHILEKGSQKVHAYRVLY